MTSKATTNADKLEAFPTNVQSQLDGKATVSHTHTASSLSGVVKTVNGSAPDGAGNVTVAAGGSPSWGAITGALSSQTDLANALNGKASSTHSHTATDLSGVVKTINGTSPDGAGNVVVSGGGTTWGGITGTLSSQTDLQTSLNAKAPLASPTFTGTVTIPTGASITNPTITNFVETHYAPAAGTAFTVDWANGTIQRFTTSGNCTITLPASVSGKSGIIEVVYGGTHTVTFAGGSTIKPQGGTLPTATSVSGKRDRYVVEQDGTYSLISDGGRNF